MKFHLSPMPNSLEKRLVMENAFGPVSAARARGIVAGRAKCRKAARRFGSEAFFSGFGFLGVLGLGGIGLRGYSALNFLIQVLFSKSVEREMRLSLLTPSCALMLLKTDSGVS